MLPSIEHVPACAATASHSPSEVENSVRILFISDAFLVELLFYWFCMVVDTDTRGCGDTQEDDRGHPPKITGICMRLFVDQQPDIRLFRILNEGEHSYHT